MRTNERCSVPSLALVACTALAATGCTSMSIRIDPPIRADAELPASECAVRLFSPSSGFLAECAKIGEMSLGDSGFTWTRYCGAIQVREAVRAKTCEAGGNAAVITRLARPMMTCVEARAVLYRCDPDDLPERPAWATSPIVASGGED